MLQKPSTRGGFRPPIPRGRHLYEASAEIYRLDGAIGDAHTHRQLRRITYRITRLGNLMSSFQIEGISIDRAAVARALAGRQTRTPFETDIVRFAELYDELHDTAQPTRLTPETILQWHARLFTPETLDHGRPGEWKTDVNGIWDAARNDWVFLATPKEDTVAELDAMLRWFDTEAYKLPAPIAAAILFAEFETIHPFPDGNGRIGRLLNLWALKRGGLRNAFLAPIDERFLKSRDRYYDALASTNSGESYDGYCGYYLAELQAAYAQSQRLGRLDEIFRELTRESTRNVLAWALADDAGDWFKRGDYPNDERVSDATLTSALAELSNMGVLEARGERKARQYRLDWDAVMARVREGVGG